MNSQSFVPVSVVIPFFRSVTTIARALNSVANQTMRPREVIIVDDCSGDGSVELLRQLINDYEPGWIKIIELDENSGPGKARNIGWDHATQAYIAFLDSDDSWHPVKLETQYTWMERHPSASLLGHAAWYQSDSVSIETDALVEDKYLFRQIAPQRLLFSNCFSTPSIFLRRGIPLRFSATGRYCEDYDLWLRIAFSGYECFHTNHRHTFMYKNAYGVSGLSANLWLMQKGELAVFTDLYRAGHINLFLYSTVSVFSMLKFVKRCFR